MLYLSQDEYKKESKMFTPEEVSSLVLTKMKETAEAYLGMHCIRLTVRYPCPYLVKYLLNVFQKMPIVCCKIWQKLARRSTINDTKVAQCIINDGVLNSWAINSDSGPFSVLEWLFIWLLFTLQGIFEVKSTNGDTHLGGEDFDNRMVITLSTSSSASTRRTARVTSERWEGW